MKNKKCNCCQTKIERRYSTYRSLTSFETVYICRKCLRTNKKITTEALVYIGNGDARKKENR
jgi:hypothetical protein